MNITELLTRVRDIMSERVGISNAALEWEDAELLRNLNAANDMLWKYARQADENWGIDSQLLSEMGAAVTTIDTDQYHQVRLTEPAHTIVLVEEKLATGGWTEVKKINLREARWHRPNPIVADRAPRGWFLGATDREMFFTWSARGLDTTTIRLWKLRSPVHMARFAVSTYPDTSSVQFNPSSAPTLGTMTRQPRHYEGATFQFTTSGVATGSPLGRTFVAATYTASTGDTMKLTFYDAHLVSSGNSVLEILPPWPDEHHELLALIAARRAFLRGSHVDERISVEREIGPELAGFINNVEQRQFQWPRHVMYEESEQWP